MTRGRKKIKNKKKSHMEVTRGDSVPCCAGKGVSQRIFSTQGGISNFFFTGVFQNRPTLQGVSAI
jgi:hypothetical protein